MKYILVLGIIFKKYRNPAKVKIMLGGNFLDAFTLEKDYLYSENIMSMIDREWYNRMNCTHWLKLSKDKDFKKDLDPWMNMPKLFKVYHVTEQNLHGHLEIEVQNDNSDYNNGFVSKSSTVSFPIIALFPSHLCRNKGEGLMKMYRRIARLFEKHVEPNFADKDLDKSAIQWPLVRRIYVERQNNKYETSSIKNFEWDKLGGSFTAKIDIKTKHKIKFLGLIDQKEIGVPLGATAHSQVLASCIPLLNIYNEN